MAVIIRGLSTLTFSVLLVKVEEFERVRGENPMSEGDRVETLQHLKKWLIIKAQDVLENDFSCSMSEFGKDGRPTEDEVKQAKTVLNQEIINLDYHRQNAEIHGQERLADSMHRQMMALKEFMHQRG